MLKGYVFAEQLFENPIFALFINTFLNGNNGVASGYLNNMALTYSGGNVTIASGAICIQGRFLGEATSTTLSVGQTNKFHKLVIEIDLDKTNTAQSFEQGYYKILSASGSYPSVTQTDIVKNVSGIYQYELARFKTDSSGNITDWADKREFLDISSIYTAIEASATALMNSIESDADGLIDELQEELQEARDNSLYALKNEVVYVNNTGRVQIDGNPDGVLNRATFAGTCYTVDDSTHGTQLAFTVPLPKNALHPLTASNTDFTINSLKGGIVAGDGSIIVPKQFNFDSNSNPIVKNNEFAIRDNFLIVTIEFQTDHPGITPETHDIELAMPYFLYVNSIDISFEPI